MATRPVSPSDAHFDDDAEPVADAEADTSAPDADSASAADVEALRGEMQILQEKLLRQAAEYQNYRRRSEGDRLEAVRQGRRGVLLPILDVFDDLGRSVEAARRAAEQDASTPATDALAEGVELVYKKFQDALVKIGVAPIEAVGKPFDENEHEAMMQQPAPDDAESGTVLAEIQPGYRLGDRVLRHARVIVAE
ncbi:MAG: nucleotide exchange factor GrpE [Bacteroidota bacterium]